MDLFLHIGTEKTGTTSIQQFMSVNRSVLLDAGVWYPRAPGDPNHIGLAALAQERDRGELWRKLRITTLEERNRYRAHLESEIARELGGNVFRVTVMSNEHCSSRLKSDSELVTLRDFLGRFFSSIRVVIYMRRQDDFLLSTYSTEIKSGRTDPVRTPPDRKINTRYDYWQLVSRWARVFGRENIICKKFEKGSLLRGDVVTDFLSVTGCDLSLKFDRPENVNTSLDARSLEFLRLLNMEAGPEGRRTGIVAMLESVSDGPLLDLPESERIEFMAKLRASNALVAKEYFGGESADSDDPLFAPRADKRERVCDQTLDVETAVRLSARLLSLPPGSERRRGRPVAVEAEQPRIEEPNDHPERAI